jgi:hypothetical protein
MTVLRYPGIPYFQSDPCGNPQNIMKFINFPHRDIVFSLFFSVLAVPWGTTTLVFSIVVGWKGLKMIKACSFSQHVVLIGNYDDTTTTSQTLQYSYVYIIINPILQKIRKYGLSIGFLHFGVPITVSLYFDGGGYFRFSFLLPYSHLLLKS